jgi:alcohol dehydrogenase class IV
MAATFFTAGKIVTGRGAFNQLASCASRFGRNVLVVTGRSAMRKAGITDRAIKSLEAAGCSVALFQDVPPEPSLDSVDAGLTLLREGGADGVVGIGGGSVMDVAKAIGGLARSSDTTEAHFAGKALPDEGVPIIAIPTTAGTGAEVTRNSVLSHPTEPMKQSIRGDVLMPTVAIVDPELTVHMPPEVTARSGMDALTQAIESYWSIHATPITEPLALSAIDLVSRNLLRAFDDGDDLDAREAMTYGSLSAGMAFANSRLGAVHGMAHPLGIRHHIPHGEVCAILLPHVMRLNRQAVPEKYDRISQIVGGDAADFAADMLEALDVPTTLAHVGLKASDFDVIVAESMPSGSLKANPKAVTVDDLLEILGAVS